MNKEINVTIINKGLDNEVKHTTLYHTLNNIGNGGTKDNSNLLNISNYKLENMTLTKLNDFIGFLCSINLALIKLDVEGS